MSHITTGNVSNVVMQFSDALFDQKSPALLVPVADGGDNTSMINGTYRLNPPRGRFSENITLYHNMFYNMKVYNACN